MKVKIKLFIFLGNNGVFVGMNEDMKLAIELMNFIDCGYLCLRENTNAHH